MVERFDAIVDAIVIGAGISGETCAHRLRLGGMRVALVERERIGGECAYWATIPTATTLISPANAIWRAQALSGIASPVSASPRSLTSSEILLSSLDERTQVDTIEQEGGVFFRGEAHFIGRDQIEVDHRRLQAPYIVIASGSEASTPQIPGLSEVGFWTARDATTASAIPQSVVILGGEAQAVEIGQKFRLYGAEVHLITRGNHLLADENPEIGKLLAQRLRRQGMRVVLGHSVVNVGRDDEHACVVTLDDTTEVHAQALVVATRRHPRTQNLSLEQVGIKPEVSGIAVDDTCRAAEGVWAVGSVTGIAQLSHMAQYQAHVAADDILGQPHPAQYHSVPRVLYCDPQIAVTGWTGGRTDGKWSPEIVSVSVDLNEKKPHPTSARQAESGKLTLFADSTRGALIGAWAAATEASDWIQLAVLAIRSEMPLDVLRDTLEQFPPFGEIYLAAVDQVLMAVAHQRKPA